MLRKLLREPLLYFSLIGALLFTLAEGGATEAIVVTPALRHAMAQDFERKHQVPPTLGQINALVNTWVDDEILFREAKRLQLEEGDPVLRRRLIASMRFLVEDEAVLGAPTRVELEQFFADNASYFETRPTLTFEHVFFKNERAEPGAAKNALMLLSSGQPFSGGDPFLHAGAMTMVSQEKLAGLFGQAFSRDIFQASVGKWSGPIQSSYGAHLVQVTEKNGSAMPPLSSVGNRVKAKWLEEKRSTAFAERMMHLRNEYHVVEQGDSAL